MSGGGGDTTTTTKAELPAYVQPYAQQLLQTGVSAANRPYQQYPGQQIAGFTPDQLQAMGMVENMAENGNAQVNAGGTNLNNTLNGDYLNWSPGSNPLLGVDNPYLQQRIDQSNQDITNSFNNNVQNSTDAQFARSGAFGGSAWQQAQAQNSKQLADSLAANTSGMQMQDYQNQEQLYENQLNRAQQQFQSERNNMMQGSLLAPQYQQAAYQNAQALAGVGDTQQGLNQNQLDLGYQNWLNQYNYPLQQMQILSSAIQGATGGGMTNTMTAPNPNRTNPLSTALGGAATGAAIGSVVPGIGTAIGAGAGGLLGLVGGLL